MRQIYFVSLGMQLVSRAGGVGQIRERGKQCWPTAGEPNEWRTGFKHGRASLRNLWIASKHASLQSIMQIFWLKCTPCLECGTYRSTVTSISIITGG